MAKKAIHGTAGSTASTVTLDRHFPRIQVVNRGTTDIFFTTDGSVPAVAGDDTFVVAKASTVIVSNQGPLPEPVYTQDDMEEAQKKYAPHTVVKLIASANTDFSVMGAN
jgi:hypothetical protein